MDELFLTEERLFVRHPYIDIDRCLLLLGAHALKTFSGVDEIN